MSDNPRSLPTEDTATSEGHSPQTRPVVTLLATPAQQARANQLKVVRVTLGDDDYAVDLGFQEQLVKKYPSAFEILKWRASNRAKYALTGAASFLKPKMFGFLADSGCSAQTVSRERKDSMWPVDHMHTGVLVVLGETGAGKTTYLDQGMRDKPDYIIRLGEPVEEVDYEQDRAIRAYGLTDAVEIVMLLSRVGHSVAIDGMRPLVYASSGAALKGGISSALFDSLTSLNNVCADAGVTFIITLNPMLGESTEIESLYSKVAASTAGAVLIQNAAVTHSQLRVTKKPFRVMDTLVGKFEAVGSGSGPKSGLPRVDQSDLGSPRATDDEPYYKQGLGLPSGVVHDDDDDRRDPPQTFNVTN